MKGDENNTGSETVTFRQILVAVDSSRDSKAALEAAAKLARAEDAELCGMFVEDAVWSRLCRYSTFHEINALTGDIRPVANQQMKEEIRLLEKSMKNLLKEISERNKLRYSWKSASGSVEQEIMKAAKDADLITIGRAGLSYNRKQKLGKSAQKIIQQSDKPVLLLQHGLTLRQPLVTIYDGSPESLNAVKTALSLARKGNGKLTVISLVNKTKPEHGKTKEKLEELINNLPEELDARLYQNNDISKFTRTVNRQNCGLLIIPKNLPLFRNYTLKRLLDMLECPILLVN